ncbi:hypothetical protein BaRGS_00034121 [Batillaria attramentaria]|uniref:Uncharacterized protein n=1 Tax=Batillaria attramentaria TaxID=370345 RepID=A0ABD0JI68_9CAEN
MTGYILLLLLSAVTLTRSAQHDVNTDELWKKVERLTDTSNTLSDQLHNLTRDVSKHARRLDDMVCPAAFPVHEARLSALEALVTRLVDNTDNMTATVDSVRDRVQTLTTDTQNMEQQLHGLRAQGDNLTLEIQRLKSILVS